MNQGKILLVGLGPGDAAHMSMRAQQAIDEAHVIIGYSTYIKLLRDRLAGKEVIRKGMTEELDRCHEALAHAQQGKTVALVSSGDTGVYGMAGPTYEVLLQSGWKPGSGIEVEVIPGSTALNACAALVGAPLTHDFCSISLSDLLTPWPVIARRLEAAARTDFVVALYNPKSGRRTQQIVEAQRAFLRHRSPDTPVALVKSAYRPRQSIQLVTLKEMVDCDIGMLTTVLIGNSSTFYREGLMVTPRGYAHKYDAADGTVHDGEQAGRSLSMGLIGWKACARRYLREHPQATLRDAANHFDVPLAEILSAVSEAHADDFAGIHQAVAAVHGEQEKVLDFARSWGSLRAIVRSESSAVAELLLNGEELTRNGNRLNCVNAQFHIHIPWNNVHQAWITGKEGLVHGALFTDVSGSLVFSLLRRTPDAPFDLEQFTKHFDWVTPAVPSVETETTSDE